MIGQHLNKNGQCGDKLNNWQPTYAIPGDG